MKEAAFPIVCFSHLAWDAYLFQRPQQLMARFAEMGHPVFYFSCVGYRKHRDHPMAGPVVTHPGVQVFTLPYAPNVKKMKGVRRWMASLRAAWVLARQGVRRPVLWFYHPGLFALGYSHADSAIVYDVMDHFVSFEESEDDFYFDELTLLAEADAVFTGGRSLDKAIRSMMDVLLEGSPGKATAPPVRCLPSGVDVKHFGRAMNAAGAVQANATGAEPVFGYFGAVDERIDWDIITALAARTSGRVVLAGPIIGGVPDELPNNVELLGGVSYESLPDILAGFTVCLIPFRQSSLVAHVSPTKTPEYLAGGKPVVSTAIPDVIADYADLVSIGKSADDFVEKCLAAAEGEHDAQGIAASIKGRAASWEAIAEEMLSRVSEIVEKGR